MDSNSYFAKPDRSSIENLRSDQDFLESEKLFLDIFGSFSGIAAILNENRQIVYGNNELLDMLGIGSLEHVLGRRPGEAVSCIHSNENINGCGTSESCRYCGAVSAIITAQQTGEKTTGEARITTSVDGRSVSLDLRVSASPLQIKGKLYYVFTLQDISNEKRKDNLERIFFHDLMNSAGSLNCLLNVIKAGTDPQEEKQLIDMSEEVSRDIIDEIISHRQLRAAENGDLVPDFKSFRISELVNFTVGKTEKNIAGLNKEIRVSEISSETTMETDRMLFQRVLMNLLKNALEATEEGGIIYLDVIDCGEKVRFEVKNSMIMPEEIKFQVFQRSFSTKGTGRGLGTYSVKLITENYLQGKAGFESSERSGTVFFVEFKKLRK